MNLTSPSELKQILNKHGFAFSKGLGQNFLIDEHVLNQIITASGITAEMGALEIGPGAGVLTRALSEHSAKTVAVEIDKKLKPLLADTLSGRDNIRIIWEDVMKLDLAALLREEFGDMPVAVAANLPYYITTPILMKFLEEHQRVESLTVMVQKEVADRMTAPPGGKEYGALSVAIQYYTIPEFVCKAEPHCFLPQPKVASSVLKLTVRKDPPVPLQDERLFFAVVRAVFNKRRKTLLNALSSDAALDLDKQTVGGILKKLQIEEQIRGERLNIAEFAAISNEIANHQSLNKE